MSFVGRMVKSLQKKYQDKLALASSTAEESISNIRTVRFFSNENKMVSSYAKDINQSFLLGRKLAAVMGVLIVALPFCIFYIMWYVSTGKFGLSGLKYHHKTHDLMDFNACIGMAKKLDITVESS